MRELTGAYVLGAITAEERAVFETHLTTCPECAAEVASMRAASGALAQAVPQVQPPAALRDRVLSVGRGRSDARVHDVPAPSIVVAKWGWLGMAASLAVAVGLGAYSIQLRGRVSLLETRLQDALQRANASERQIADARRASFEAQSQIAVLTAPDMARADLAGQPSAPSAQARAFWSRSRGLVFTASNLPPLPAGRIYQLWLIAGKTPISAGIFGPDQAGGASLLFTTAPDVPRPDLLAVTIEPAGGVPQPTTAPFLVGSVPGL